MIKCRRLQKRFSNKNFKKLFVKKYALADRFLSRKANSILGRYVIGVVLTTKHGTHILAVELVVANVPHWRDEHQTDLLEKTDTSLRGGEFLLHEGDVRRDDQLTHDCKIEILPTIILIDGT